MKSKQKKGRKIGDYIYKFYETLLLCVENGWLIARPKIDWEEHRKEWEKKMLEKLDKEVKKSKP